MIDHYLLHSVQLTGDISNNHAHTYVHHTEVLHSSWWDRATVYVCQGKIRPIFNKGHWPSQYHTQLYMHRFSQYFGGTTKPAVTMNIIFY